MLASAAFLVFFVFSLFFIYAQTRRKQLQLHPSEILLAFGFKVLMGCLYGYIFYKYYGGDDTWALHNGSIEEYQKLMHNPGRFLADFDVTASFRRNDSFAAAWYYLFSDLEYWLITKPLAIFNMYSRGNYYINIVFFNLLTFGGQYLLYKLLAARFPEKRNIVLWTTFLFPPAAFWLSGIRGDGMIVLAMGITLYYFHAWLWSRRVKHFVVSVIGLLGLIIFRSPVLLLLMPGLMAWFIAEKYGLRAWKVFAIIYGGCVVLFFGSAYLSPSANMLTYVVHRQQEFFALKGNTVFALNALETNVSSFVNTLPQAFMNTVLRPFPWEAKGALQWFTAITTTATLIMLVVALVLGVVRRVRVDPVIWLFLFFGISFYLFIGYTVPFPGAIARYKVLPELLLLLSALMMLRTDKKIL